MSIFSEWRNGKIGWAEATKQAAAYMAAFVNHSPALKALTDAEVVIFKQAASNAISIVDTAAAPLINTAAAAINTAAVGLFTAYVGPVGSAVLTPATADAVNLARDALIAEIHAAALQFKADLAAGASTAVTPAAPPLAA